MLIYPSLRRKQACTGGAVTGMAQRWGHLFRAMDSMAAVSGLPPLSVRTVVKNIGISDDPAAFVRSLPADINALDDAVTSTTLRRRRDAAEEAEAEKTGSRRRRKQARTVL